MTAKIINSLSILKLLLQLDPYKSMGPDGIYLRILKELADIITKPLLIIFERSWESREVPPDWKLTNLAQVFKKSKKNDPGHSRPVSLPSVPGKVIEQSILGGIEIHLKENAIIGNNQHSFMRGQCCLSNIFSFYDKETHLVDEGKSVDVIFLGLILS